MLSAGAADGRDGQRYGSRTDSSIESSRPVFAGWSGGIGSNVFVLTPYIFLFPASMLKPGLPGTMRSLGQGCTSFSELVMQCARKARSSHVLPSNCAWDASLVLTVQRSPRDHVFHYRCDVVHAVPRFCFIPCASLHLVSQNQGSEQNRQGRAIAVSSVVRAFPLGARQKPRSLYEAKRDGKLVVAKRSEREERN